MNILLADIEVHLNTGVLEDASVLTQILSTIIVGPLVDHLRGHTTRAAENFVDAITNASFMVSDA